MDATDPARTSGDPPADRGRPDARELLSTEVVVASDQHLVAEAIRAALGGLGFDTALVDWVARDPAVPPVPRPRRPGQERPARVLLMACDLDLRGRLTEARALAAVHGIPWIVVDASGPGPAWGAVLEAGAGTVVVSWISLDDLIEVIELVAHGGSSLDQMERRALIRQWHEVEGSPEELLRQMQGLDPGDREILAMLYAGTTIQAIAARFDLSERAVSAQVKAVLRRLSLP